MSNNLTSLINSLRFNLNITDLTNLLSSPVANITEFKAIVANFTILRSNDPDLVSNQKLTTSLNSSLQNIYSKVSFTGFEFFKNL